MHRTAHLIVALLMFLHAAADAQAVTRRPWQDASLSPAQRAELVLKEMTLDEKITLLHGTGQPGHGSGPAEQRLSNGGAGFAVGVPRLGIPGIQMADAAYGVTKSGETVLTGEVDPSGKLPITFPVSDGDRSHARVTALPPASTAEYYGLEGNAHDRAGLPPFDVHYDEGLLVGYKWFAARGKQVLFPFGYGLSYTTFSMSGLVVAQDGRSAALEITNTGKRNGRAVTELYASLPTSAAEPKRLVGWESVTLAPGEQREVTIAIEPLLLSVYDQTAGALTRVAGTYVFHAGSSSADLPLMQTKSLTSR